MVVKNLKIALAFVGLALIWGGAFVAIKIVVIEIPPLHAAMIRMWIAVPYLWITFKLLKKPMKLSRQAWQPSWVAGLFMIGIPYALVFWGETKVVAGLAGVINGTVPLFTAALTSLAISPLYDPKQRLHFNLVIGLLAGFIGLITLFYPQLSQNSSADFWGTLAIVGMAFCYSLSNVLNARILAPPLQVSITANVFHQHIASLVFLSIFAPLLEHRPWDWMNIFIPKVLGSLLFLGAISGATALLIYYFLIREIGAIRTSAITYLIPVGALILDFMVFGTRPEGIVILGTLFILGGVLFIRSSPVEKQS